MGGGGHFLLGDAHVWLGVGHFEVKKGIGAILSMLKCLGAQFLC